MLESISVLSDIPDRAIFSDTHTFHEDSLRIFRDLVGDHAPIHWNDEFAVQQSFAGRIVYGFLIAAPFSRILGMSLPGPQTVIHSVAYKIHRPVYVGETLHYSVRVAKKVTSVGVVVLELFAKNESNEKVISGTAQCGFPKSAELKQ